MRERNRVERILKRRLLKIRLKPKTNDGGALDLFFYDTERNDMESPCFLCPNQCGVDREKQNGVCRSKGLKIAKYSLHPFEEPVISGTNGSGCIFFTGCSLMCVFCQNYDVSRNTRGKEISPQELAEIFRVLETRGAHNINLVNPTHFADQIAEAVAIYRPKIPIVWNSHGYETVETLERVNDFVDIYLPDLKYYSPRVSERYTGKRDYFERASEAILYMLNKTALFESGLLKRGVVVRHLILPLNSDDSVKILEWFSSVKDRCMLSLMAQYTPFGAIERFPELQRKITAREYRKVSDAAERLGIENAFMQERDAASEAYIPEWDF